MHWTDRISTLGVLIAQALFACACDNSRFSSSKDDGENKPRPTETSEGIVGYLVDPEKVTSSVVESVIEIRGAAEALTPIGETTAATEAHYTVWSVSPETIGAAT